MNIKNIKSWAIFSPIRYYYNIFAGNREAREKEFKKEQCLDCLKLMPIIFFLCIVVILLLIPNFLTITLTILGVCITVSYYLILITELDNYDRKIARIKAEKEYQEELERRRREERAYHEWVNYMRQEQAKERMRSEERARRIYEEYYRNNIDTNSNNNNKNQSIDQNMVNAKKLLGLKDNFTQKDVKSAYRKLSKIHHPDIGGTEENFKRLNKAYNYVMERI